MWVEFVVQNGIVIRGGIHYHYCGGTRRQTTEPTLKMQVPRRKHNHRASRDWRRFKRSSPVRFSLLAQRIWRPHKIMHRLSFTRERGGINSVLSITIFLWH